MDSSFSGKPNKLMQDVLQRTSKLKLSVDNLTQKHLNFESTLNRLASYLSGLAQSQNIASAAIDGLMEILAKEFPEKEIPRKLEEKMAELISKQQAEIEQARENLQTFSKEEKVADVIDESIN